MASGFANDSQDPVVQLRTCALSEIPELVKKFGDVNVRRSNGDIALHDLNSPERCKILIECGADVNSRNKLGWTPLDKVKDPEICKILLGSGADVNARSRYGDTPLHHARNAQICKILIEHGADINAENIDGYSPLGCKTTNIFDGGDDIFHALLYYGADTSIMIESEITTLFREYFDSLYSEQRIDLIEILFYYAYDKVQEPIDYEFLSELAGSPDLCHIFKQLLDSISMIEFPKENNVGACINFLFQVLYEYHPDNLRPFLEKFSNTVDRCLKLLRKYPDRVKNQGYGYDNLFNDFPKYDNIMILAEFNLLEDYIQLFHEELVEECGRLHDDALNSVFDQEELRRFVLTLLTLLSYGLDIKKLGEIILDDIYGILGDCELFRILVHFEWEKADAEWFSLMGRLIYDIDLSIDIYVERLDPGDFGESNIGELLEQFVHPKLLEVCRRRFNGPEFNEILAKVNQMPKVPKLLELARNSARQHIVNKFNMTTAGQFYTYLQHLEIAQVYKDILSYQRKLYV